MQTLGSGTIALLTLLGASACAKPSAAAPTPPDVVPPDRGLAAPVEACQPREAWGLNGAAVEPPRLLCCVVPIYPGPMHAAGVEGDARVRVAVDSGGIPDSASIHVTMFSTPEFEMAVRRSVPFLRFAPVAPGEHRPVIVAIPFEFRLRQRP